MRKLSFGAVTFIYLHLPIVALASGSNVIFDSSLLDETPIYDSLLVLDESSSPTYDISTAEEELLLFFDEEELFITATKIPQKISKAPAIASVINRDEIRRMGARDITDVLRRIPGFGITQGYYGKNDIEVRGIKTTNSEKIKVLIDGHSVNNVLLGSAMYNFGEMPVEGIERIEVIRGPGSALYGSNAISAVINIITQNGQDSDGTVVSISRGNFNTTRSSLQTGTKVDDFDIAFSLNTLKSDGDSMSVESDSLGRSGVTHEPIKRVDVALKLAYKDFSLLSRYAANKKGTYTGVRYALNDESEHDQSQYYVELAYDHNFGQAAIHAKLFYDRFNFKTYWEIYPEGAVSGFPDGMLAKPSLSSDTKGAEVQFDYEFSAENQFLIGASFENIESVDSGYLANYDPGAGWSPLPSGEVEDVKSLGNWTKEEQRDIWAFYFQDIWQVTDDVTLTLGARHDNYSDFGSTTNPRVALVWGFAEKWNLKVLYGKAFGAPTFEELYNDNNPAVVGNRNLDPETMTTYEVGINNAYKDASASLTYFSNQFDEKIQNVGGQFENTGGARVQGVEAEWKKGFSDRISAYLNYSYMETKDEETRKKLADIPMHRGNIGVDLKLGKYINLNTNVLVMGDRPRAPTDTRDDAPGYQLVDVTVIGKNFYKTLELRTTVHNLFDKEYVDPAPMGTLENDFPREGVSYRFEALYKF